MSRIITLYWALMAVIVGLIIVIFILLRYIRALRKKDFVIKAVHNVSEKLPQMGRREDFIKYICEVTKKITKSDEFVYFRYDEKNRLLIPEYVESPYKKQILKTTLELGEGFTGKRVVLKKGGILNHANKSKSSKHVPNTPDEDSSLLAIPMIFNEKVLGAILQVKLNKGVFTSEELNLSEIFVNIVSGFFFTKDLFYDMQDGVVQLILSLIKNVEYKDPYTAGHSIRVGHFAEIIADGLGLDKKDVLTAKIGGFLHDIGKISIEDAILKEKFILSKDDWNKIKDHPQVGAEMVGKFRFLQDVVPCILYHHKYYDGSGYPENIKIKGDEIPLCGRIVAVADALDAITTSRPGHSARSLEWAITELKGKKGTQFDPKVVDAVIKKSTEIVQFVRREFDVEDEKNYEEIAKIL
jgi:putative nucleotidyltransferase with HDIG domain